jgi:prophage maintenance system killer protein
MAPVCDPARLLQPGPSVLCAVAVFLRIDGYRLDLTDDAAFDLTLCVAAGQLDANGIEKRLRLAPLAN